MNKLSLKNRYIILYFLPINLARGGWVVLIIDLQQWIQAEFSAIVRVHSIATQGRHSHNQWVYLYRITYSLDDIFWTSANSTNGNIFIGNKNRDDQNINLVDQPFFARFVRLIPVRWEGTIGLRWEIMGCYAQGINLGYFNLTISNCLILNQYMAMIFQYVYLVPSNSL